MRLPFREVVQHGPFASAVNLFLEGPDEQLYSRLGLHREPVWIPPIMLLTHIYIV
jgi:hypothetical protein